MLVPGWWECAFRVAQTFCGAHRSSETAAAATGSVSGAGEGAADNNVICSTAIRLAVVCVVVEARALMKEGAEMLVP